MEFQVRKGLETPLKVHGMNTRFFLVYLKSATYRV